MKRLSMLCALFAMLLSVLAMSALAQITPSDDSYTLTSTPTVNFGAKNTLESRVRGDYFRPLRPFRHSSERHRCDGRQGHAEDLCQHGNDRRVLQRRPGHQFVDGEHDYREHAPTLAARSPPPCR